MRQFLVPVLGIMLTIIWGCSESTGPDPSETDEQAIIQVIQEIENSETEDYFYTSLDDESDNNFFEASESALLKPITPVRFGRIGSRPIVRDVRVIFDTDSTATAFFTTVLRGHFVVLTMNQEYEVQRIVRPMGHKFERVAHFVKRGNENMNLRERWRLLDFSMASGTSLGLEDDTEPSTTLHIQKLIIETDSVIEIEDPLEYFQTRGSVFTFDAGTEVKLTLFVENSNPNAIQVPAGKGTEFVRLHFARHRRLRLHGVRYFQWVRSEASVNVYEGTWTVGQCFCVNHAVIDVIDNGCIFDDDVDTYPYNSVTWGTPYKVTPLSASN
jgi:hypothetical protein